MHTLNLGILAHVDAGKTSLTERLLFDAGVIDEIGSVDAGSTQTDTLALERRRGITIRSAVASFVIDDVQVNLVDTPGHPDFIAEVERALSILDGVVLVVSAVEGVQAQTRVLMRAVRRLRLPTLIFLNKIDRRGARAGSLLRELTDRIGPGVVALGSVRAAGGRGAVAVPHDLGDVDARALLTERLAEHDEAALACFVAGETPPAAALRSLLAAATGQARVQPVLFGSARTGTGVAALAASIRDLLPACAPGDAEPLSGTVFKVERGAGGGRTTFLRMHSGQVRVRQRVPTGPGSRTRITGLRVARPGGLVTTPTLRAGEIGTITGWEGARIGDALGEPSPAASRAHFSPPTLETVVVPAPGTDPRALQVALGDLAAADPLIGLRRDDVRDETSLSLYGEVQKEVLQATLAEEHGLAVTFRGSTTICVERVVDVGSCAEIIWTPPNPFIATVGLRVEPAPAGAGVLFRLEVELGSMPYAFFSAVESTVRAVLGQGLSGWDVPDCSVTMTHCGYAPRQSRMHGTFDKNMSSTGADFRGLTPLVLLEALRRAGTAVHEPFDRFSLEVPPDAYAAVVPLLGHLGAVTEATRTGAQAHRLEGVLPAARVHALQQQLPALTRGEGVLETAFEAYRPVRGTPPTRARTDADPLDRKEYLLHVLRRV